MSSPLAIAAVTAALKDLLNDGLLNHDLSAVGSFSVTALPPDRVEVGQNEPNRLNIFLYQVTPNTGWRNEGLPSRDSKFGQLTNPPLALDLHYMLSAYGSQDFNAEILLGYAMFLLHQTPMLSRQQLRTVLGAPDPVTSTILPPLFGTLSALDLADQIELIKITPAYLSVEDLSKIWTAMQARYRPTMAYVVTTVLIQGTNGTKSAPPVLTQGKQDAGPVAIAGGIPFLTSARPALSDLLPAMRLGEDLQLTGTKLSSGADTTIVFDNPLAGTSVHVPPKPTKSTSQVNVHVPSFAEDADALHKWSVGLYSVSMQVARVNLPPSISTGVPVALSPTITVSPLNAPAGDITLTVTCSPRLLPKQEARTVLFFGEQSLTPTSISTPVDVKQPTTPTFQSKAVAAGAYLVRLRVDRVDSIPAVLKGTPPVFTYDPAQQVKVV